MNGPGPDTLVNDDDDDDDASNGSPAPDRLMAAQAFTQCTQNRDNTRLSPPALRQSVQYSRCYNIEQIALALPHRALSRAVPHRESRHDTTSERVSKSMLHYYVITDAEHECARAPNACRDGLYRARAHFGVMIY